MFPTAKAMPGIILITFKLIGAERLTKYLKANNIPVALATSSSAKAVELKTSGHKEWFQVLFAFISHFPKVCIWRKYYDWR